MKVQESFNTRGKGKGNHYPMIILQGQQLAQFCRIGDYVTITLENDKIIIEHAGKQLTNMQPEPVG